MAAAAVILAVSCFILANTLTRSQPINIVVEGEVITTIYSPALYQATEVAIIIVTSFAAGTSAFYLYREAKEPTVHPEKQVSEQPSSLNSNRDLKSLTTINTALKVLTGPRRRILEIMVEKGGEVLQKDILLETGYSKAKITRTLQELEVRNVVERKQYGNTKKIVLAEWMKKDTEIS
jgi:uncharacterized membrane protein